MESSHVSGVGVVDASGVLVGHLSASDLRCLAGPAFFSSLLLPVKRFLEERPLLHLVQQQLARVSILLCPLRIFQILELWDPAPKSH